MPLVMSSSIRIVTWSPFGTPSTYSSIVSSRLRSPASTSCSTSELVKVFVIDPTRMKSSTVIGEPDARSASPNASTHVPSGDRTATIAPGAEVRPRPSSAASRSRSAVSSSTGSIAPAGRSVVATVSGDGTHESPAASAALVSVGVGVDAGEAVHAASVVTSATDARSAGRAPGSRIVSPVRSDRP